VSIIESSLFTGSGDLSEAETALLENVEMQDSNPGNVTGLVKVNSLQNRYAEAHGWLVELSKDPPKYRLEAQAHLAFAERRWNQAASATLSLINILQTLGLRWEWARSH